MGEPEEPFRGPEDFVRRQGPNVVAVVVRIGLRDAQLVLVDDAGRWERWVYESTTEASRAVRALALRVYEGDYPEEVRVLMNSHVRPAEDFGRAPYREQGRVGPVIPYPENRPRRIAAPARAEEPDVDLSLHPGLR
jgi:hypothetical protein